MLGLKKGREEWEMEGGKRKGHKVGGQFCDELRGVHMIKIHCSNFSKNQALKDKSSSRVVNVAGGGGHQVRTGTGVGE